MLQCVFTSLEVVRLFLERQYQMRAEAMKLRPAINKIERLLGHNLALTDEALLNHVDAAIANKASILGLTDLKLDHGQVDWGALIRAATYRLPPFQPGEREKGFRDAIVLETFLQLVSDSPKTPQLCRLLLVTSDVLLKEAVERRIAGLSNVSVLSDIEELKGLINTLISDVTEDFIAVLKPKAAKLFFISGKDKDTLYYKSDVRQQVKDQYAGQLARKPDGTKFRTPIPTWISPPNFDTGQEGLTHLPRSSPWHFEWRSRVYIRGQLPQNRKRFDGIRACQPFWPHAKRQPGCLSERVFASSSHGIKAPTLPQSQRRETGLTRPGRSNNSHWHYSAGVPSAGSVVTHKGRDAFEILWSADLSMDKELKKGKIEEIRHIELALLPAA